MTTDDRRREYNRQQKLAARQGQRTDLIARRIADEVARRFADEVIPKLADEVVREVADEVRRILAGTLSAATVPEGDRESISVREATTTAPLQGGPSSGEGASPFADIDETRTRTEQNADRGLSRNADADPWTRAPVWDLDDAGFARRIGRGEP